MRNFIANFVGDLCGTECIGCAGPIYECAGGGGAVGGPEPCLFP